MTVPVDGPVGQGAMRHGAIALLGVVTIVAYGSWYYAFGVLLDPIRIDTGWSEAGLATSFSLGIVAVGLGAIGGGRLLDRIGGRLVLTIGGLGGGLGLLATSYSGSQAVFTIASAVAMGFLGSLGFYHITMTMAVRIHPDDPSRAIATLTIWGAFASVIYLPAVAALVERLEWRATIRLMGIIVLVVFGLAAIVLGGPAQEPGAVPDRPPLRQVLASTMERGQRRSFTIAVGLGGVAMSTVLVYQVPTMTAIGLPLSTAATMAGIRGFAQTGGRIPLGRIVKRLGSDGALVLAFSAMAVGGALLAFASTVPVALAFAVITGFGIGAYSPLQGIKAEELYEREALGATMGSYSTIMMLSGAAGPAVAGLLADGTGDRRMVSLVIAGSAAGATWFALRLRRDWQAPQVDRVA